MTSEILRFATFAIIGVLNSVVDIALYLSFINSIGKIPWLNKGWIKITTISHVLSFSVAVIFSYIMNSHFTFADSSRNAGFTNFLLVSLVALGISTVLIQSLTSERIYLNFRSKIKPSYDKIRHLKPLSYFSDTRKLFYLFVKIVTIFVVMMMNYIGYQLFVF